MAVLVQYNDHDTLSLDELLEATGISKEILVQVLGVLVKAKILINEEQDQYDLNPSKLHACVMIFIVLIFVLPKITSLRRYFIEHRTDLSFDANKCLYRFV